MHSVGFVGGKERRFYGLHARRTCEASHQPVVNTFDVVCVHTWQVTYRVAYHKLYHTNDTSETRKNKILDKYQNYKY